MRRTRPGRCGRGEDGLAAASEKAQVYPREVEAVRRELQARGFSLQPQLVQAVSYAFLADAVAKPSALRPRIATQPS